ncbi:hypothetical protein C8J56DRAFT_172610 [Mycena floridula]|nr:hypothetical protein C8J56DRAFT_172610 [Mycena floridula]
MSLSLPCTYIKVLIVEVSLSTPRHYSCNHQCPYHVQKLDCHKRDCALSDYHRSQQHRCIGVCRQNFRKDQHLLTDDMTYQCDKCLFPEVEDAW